MTSICNYWLVKAYLQSNLNLSRIFSTDCNGDFIATQIAWKSSCTNFWSCLAWIEGEIAANYRNENASVAGVILIQNI